MKKWKIYTVILLCAGILAAGVIGLYRGYILWKHPLEYQDAVTQYAGEYEVNPYLVFAVIKTESSFNPLAQSDAGAQGLMQITPDTFDWLETKIGEELSEEAVFTPETAIQYGTYFLHYLLDEFGDTRTALAAYHAGRGQVNTWLEDPAVSQDGKKLDDIPSRETAHYVNKVMRALQIYQNLYDNKG